MQSDPPRRVRHWSAILSADHGLPAGVTTRIDATRAMQSRPALAIARAVSEPSAFRRSCVLAAHRQRHDKIGASVLFRLVQRDGASDLRADRGGNLHAGIFAGLIKRDCAVRPTDRAAEGLGPIVNIAQLANKKCRVAPANVAPDPDRTESLAQCAEAGTPRKGPTTGPS